MKTPTTVSLHLLTAGLILAFASVVPGTAVAIHEPELSGLDEFIENGMDDWDIPGMAVGIVKDGELVHA